MEATRCLRHLFVHQIQLLDISMGMEIDLVDIYEFLGEPEYDDNQSHCNY